MSTAPWIFFFLAFTLGASCFFLVFTAVVTFVPKVSSYSSQYSDEILLELSSFWLSDLLNMSTPSMTSIPKPSSFSYTLVMKPYRQRYSAIFLGSLTSQAQVCLAHFCSFRKRRRLSMVHEREELEVLFLFFDLFFMRRRFSSFSASFFLLSLSVLFEVILQEFSNEV